MENSKLVHFLRYLRLDEIKPFQDYLASPYFKVRPQVSKLFQILYKKIKAGKNAIWSKEEIYREIFSKQEMNENAFRKLCSELLRKLWDFWAIHKLENSEFQKRIYLLQELEARGEEKYWLGLYRNCKEQMNQGKVVGTSSFEDNYNLELSLSKYQTRLKQRGADLNLDSVYKELQNSHWLRILKWANSTITLAMFNSTSYQAVSDKVSNTIEEMETSIGEAHFLIRLYYYLFQSLVNSGSEEAFILFKTELLKSADLLNTTDQDDLFMGLVNYCIRKINQGAQSYHRELFLIFQQMVSKHIGMPDGRMPQPFLKNLVSLGSRLGEFVWVEKLIEDYGGKLIGENSSNALQFNLGVLAFHREDWSTSSKHLHRVMSNLHDIFYGLDARAFLLKIYYKKQDLTGMEALTHSFRMYLERQIGISEAHKKNYGAFIRFFRRLFPLAPHETSKILKLKEEIIETTAISGKNWLLENLADLNKN